MPIHALRAAEPNSGHDALSEVGSIEAAGAASEAPLQPKAPSSAWNWRVLLHRAAPVGIVAIIAAMVYLLAKLLAGLDFSMVAASALGTKPHVIVLSLLFSALSYCALTGYDVFGVRAATDKSVPFRTIAAASFTSYAIGHTLGFPLFTAGAVRWRIYGAAGLNLAEVAKLTAVAALTLWTGMAAVLGISATLEPQALAALDRLPVGLNQALGIALLLALAGYVFWGRRGERAIGRGEARVRLPGGKAAVAQIVLGLVDISAAAAALWVFLPPDIDIGFPAFAALFAGGILLAIASHVPAGLGAFEAALLLALPDVPTAELVSAVLVWRLTYTLIPFLIAVTIFAIHEMRRSETQFSHSQRAASGGSSCLSCRLRSPLSRSSAASSCSPPAPCPAIIRASGPCGIWCRCPSPRCRISSAARRASCFSSCRAASCAVCRAPGP